MDKKRISKKPTWLFLAIALFAICTVSFFLFLHSTTFKKIVEKELYLAAEAAGHNLQIGKIDLSSPLAPSLHKVKMESKGINIEIESIDLSFNPLPLFFGTLSFSKIEIGKTLIKFNLDQIKKPTQNSIKKSVRINELHAKSITCINLQSGKSCVYTLYASGQLKSDGLLSELDFHLRDFVKPENSLEMLLSKSKRAKTIEVSLSMALKERSSIAPFVELTESPNIRFSAHLEGPETTWKALLNSDRTIHSKPLRGHIDAKVFKMAFPIVAQFDRPFSLESTLSLHANGAIEVAGLSLKSPLLILKAEALLSADFKPQSGSFLFTLPKLSLLPLPIHLDGSISGQGELAENSAHLTLTSKNLFIEQIPFSDGATGNLTAQCDHNKWSGNFSVISSGPSIPADIGIAFSLNQESLCLEKILCKVGQSRLMGRLTIDRERFTSIGDLYANIPAIAELSPFFPILKAHSVRGSIGANLHLSDDGTGELSLASSYLEIDDFIERSLELNARFATTDPSFNYTLSLSSPEGSWRSIPLKKTRIELAREDNRTTFDISIAGYDREPFYLKTRGEIEALQGQSITLKTLSARYMDEKFELHKESTLLLSPKKLLVEGLRINSSRGFFQINGDITPEKTALAIEGTNFPLAPFFAPFPDILIQGIASMRGELLLSGSEQTGTLNLILADLLIKKFDEKKGLQLRGNLSAALSSGHLQLITGIKAIGDQFFDLTATIPIRLYTFPFEVALPQDQKISAKLAADGYIEELFDFIDIGAHTVKGLLSAEMTLSNTLETPHLSGKIYLDKGLYENYYTGTEFNEISAFVVAEKSAIEIKKFSAFDQKSGALSAKGFLQLAPDKNYPFNLLTRLANLQTINLETIKTRFSGEVRLLGDSQDATLSGTVKSTIAELEIPEKLPAKIDVLPVEFLFPPHDLQLDQVSADPLYPLNLDIKLLARDRVYLRGNGLTSEWRGQLALKGTAENPVAVGKCTLIKGEYHLGSKTFQLTEGTITFSDKIKDGAYISLKGVLQLHDVIIQINYSGPLFSPELTFTSSPYMPTGSILSHILFNKDLSEITPLQAVQLAPIIVSLAGNSGPDILQLIRKNLGIDKLIIVPGARDSDETSVHIGKYLVDGVMVTLSRTASDSQVMVEVELKKGFTFQAETQEEEEGKFTLKWNYNY